MLSVLLIRTTDQGLSVKRTLLVFVALLSSAGCSSLPPKVSQQSLIGKPLTALVAVYGVPGYCSGSVTTYPPKKHPALCEFTLGKDGYYAPLSVNTTTGYVGDQPVSLTSVTAGEGWVVKNSCNFSVWTDADGNVKKTSAVGGAVCRKLFES